MARVLSSYKPLLYFFLFSLLWLFLSRTALTLWQFERVSATQDWFNFLLGALRIDISTVAYLLIIPTLLQIIAHCFSFLSAVMRPIIFIWLVLSAFILVFMEFSTPAFIMEYDLRPNRLFVEYLLYPQEVFSMLLTGHLLEVVLASIGCTIVMYFTFGLLKAWCNSQHEPLPLLPSLFSGLLVVVMIFLAARGTLQHRPINPSLAYFSTDPLVNSLTLNSSYSLAFAIKQLGNEASASKIYGTMDEVSIIAHVQAQTAKPSTGFNHAELPTLASNPAVYQGKPKNLVIVLQESLGAQFVQSLGGKNLAPEFDKLLNQGWSFDQLYATGTRSVRGIEAVVTGFTPTPARAVVKLDKSQHNFFTLAALLQQEGYATQFIYGGESHFDNMKSFFLGNGFTDIVDFDDIEQPEFVGSWGASDGDLFRQADKELQQFHLQDKPFFSLIFSSSNHDPFEIPTGKVTGIDETERSRDNAIRYADFALGEFIAKAKTQPYWQDTIFLVVADHDARVFGANLVPIKSFHIPGVILGKDIDVKRDTRTVSQIDLAPTVLSLMGINAATPMLGRDLNRTDINQRAMMQFDKNFAYLEGDKVAILQPEKPISYYRYDYVGKELIAINDVTAELETLGQVAKAHALFGSLAYNKNWFRLATQIN